MDATDDFVNRIVEATNQEDWQGALDIWNDLSREATSLGQNEKIIEVYQGLSESGVSMAEVVQRAFDA